MPRLDAIFNRSPIFAEQPTQRRSAFIISPKEQRAASPPRLIGSVAFAAVARVVLIAAKQAGQEGDAPERRILMRAKSNIGPDQSGFAYRLEQIELEQHAGVFASRAVWGEPIGGTARDALADAERLADERRPVEKAKDFLLELLADGPIGPKQVKSAADGNGHSWALSGVPKTRFASRRARPASAMNGPGACRRRSHPPKMLTTMR